ncbi:MAG: 50S ribosomal protein L7ae [Euryarchaeota archaeon]|nr:50S ribosomal protein L7ae [Euryarchaeota archaeon]
MVESYESVSFISATPCGGLPTRGVVPMSVHIAFETPSDIQEQVYEMVKSLGKDERGRLKKGANEVTKAAERGTAKMVVMAENVNPGELLAHIPMICKEKSIPFIYVEDQAYLAEAAGMSLGTRTAAIAVMDVDKEAEDKFKEVDGHCSTLSQ